VLLLAAVAVLLLAVVPVAVLLARDGRAPAGPAAPTVTPLANHAVRIDPATLQAVATVPVGTDPAAVVGGGGLVWVANRQNGTVTVVNPATNQVQQTMPASGSGPGEPQAGPGLGFASGNLWVANTDQQQVARVEPDAEPATIPVDGRPSAITAAPDADAVWVAARTPGGGLLARIDAGTNRLGRPVSLPRAPTGLAITPDRRTVWVATGSDRILHRVNASAGSVVGQIKLPLVPDQVAVGDGAVWVTSSGSDAVLRINPTTPSKPKVIRVGNRPSGIAFGAGRVWVANAEDGTVSTIDPQSNQVGTTHLGFRPAAVAVDQGAVWVALAA
jgi:YVTN family beta-propeller protein